MNSGDLNIDLSEKLTELVSKSFLTSFRTLFSNFSLQRLGAELDWGEGASRRPPPSADHGSFGAPARRGLRCIRKVALQINILCFLDLLPLWIYNTLLFWYLGLATANSAQFCSPFMFRASQFGTYSLNQRKRCLVSCPRL